jgi:hypothetical protein
MIFLGPAGGGMSGIDTREELLDALTRASELEHGVLIQYLFAAYSLKKRADEGLGPAEQELVRSWAGTLTTIAREEMAHLGCVCNLMAAIGGAPRMGRPNFPQPAGRYHPFDFRLQRFGDEALYRFVCLELPEDEPPPAPPRRGRVAAIGEVVPDPLTFTYLGELYRKIRRGFGESPEAELFIGPEYTQDSDDWSNRFSLRVVTDRPAPSSTICVPASTRRPPTVGRCSPTRWWSGWRRPSTPRTSPSSRRVTAAVRRDRPSSCTPTSASRRRWATAGPSCSSGWRPRQSPPRTSAGRCPGCGS